MFMRGRLKTALLVLTLFVLASPLQAQMLPWNIGVDSWFGIDYLLARQDILYRPSYVANFSQLGVEWTPRLPALSGMVEVSPVPFASARLAGSISVAASKDLGVRSTAVIAGPSRWDVRTDFSSWEAAGLYHLWNGGGYRFSVTAGYRRETWLHHGDPIEIHPLDSSLREEIRSDIPFIGLQTAMNFPLWKARFEVMGSWFVTKKIQQSIQLSQASERMEGNGDHGGIIMLQMDGATQIRPNVTLGLYARYSYQEFFGRSLVTTGATGTVVPFQFDYNENVFAAGANIGLIF
jgi:hypothetical protein